MARVLIVGCGCRGRALIEPLSAAGHTVRGTSRDSARLGDIEAAGAEAVLADPDRLGTLLPALVGVSSLCWLLGSATGETAADLHGPRLETVLEHLVDTPVRGFVYEAAGRAPLGRGPEIVRAAGERWRIPVEVVREDPADHPGWLAAMSAAVGRTLA